MIFDLLGVGEENAIRSSDLLVLAGLETTRELRIAIAKERNEGKIIVSSNAGYFKPRTREELEQFYNTFTAKAKTMFRNARFVKRKLKECKGQTVIRWTDDKEKLPTSEQRYIPEPLCKEN